MTQREAQLAQKELECTQRDEALTQRSADIKNLEEVWGSWVENQKLEVVKLEQIREEQRLEAARLAQLLEELVKVGEAQRVEGERLLQLHIYLSGVQTGQNGQNDQNLGQTGRNNDPLLDNATDHLNDEDEDDYYDDEDYYDEDDEATTQQPAPSTTPVVSATTKPTSTAPTPETTTTTPQPQRGPITVIAATSRSATATTAKTTPATVCPDDGTCYDRDCRHTHLQERGFKKRPCPQAKNCPAPHQCPYFHPSPHQPMSYAEGCPNGLKCTGLDERGDDCPFDHKICSRHKGPCTDDDCPRIHLECPRDGDCTLRNCRHTHPKGYGFIHLLCVHRDECSRWMTSCPCYHPPRSLEFLEAPCPKGVECLDKFWDECAYNHVISHNERDNGYCNNPKCYRIHLGKNKAPTRKKNKR